MAKWGIPSCVLLWIHGFTFKLTSLCDISNYFGGSIYKTVFLKWYKDSIFCNYFRLSCCSFFSRWKKVIIFQNNKIFTELKKWFPCEFRKFSSILSFKHTRLGQWVKRAGGRCGTAGHPRRLPKMDSAAQWGWLEPCLEPLRRPTSWPASGGVSRDKSWT